VSVVKSSRSMGPIVKSVDWPELPGCRNRAAQVCDGVGDTVKAAEFGTLTVPAVGVWLRAPA